MGVAPGGHDSFADFWRQISRVARRWTRQTRWWRLSDGATGTCSGKALGSAFAGGAGRRDDVSTEATAQDTGRCERRDCGRRVALWATRSWLEVPQSVSGLRRRRDGRSAGQEQHERRGNRDFCKNGGKGAVVRTSVMRGRRKASAQGVARRPTAQRRRSGRRSERRHNEEGAGKAVPRSPSAARAGRKSRPVRGLCSLILGAVRQLWHRRARGAKKTRRSFWGSAAFLLCRRRSVIWPAARIRPRSRPDRRRDPPR